MKTIFQFFKLFLLFNIAQIRLPFISSCCRYFLIFLENSKILSKILCICRLDSCDKIYFILGIFTEISVKYCPRNAGGWYLPIDSAEKRTVRKAVFRQLVNRLEQIKSNKYVLIRY